MTAKTNASEPLDRSTLEAMMIRWKLAEQHLADPTDNPETGRMALQFLIAYDFPALVEELTRLRPELAVP
jgi:hypothetical protein